MKTALIIVDLQNDFCEKGALSVPKADEIIPYVNDLLERKYYDQIILTQDFHPSNHKSFASNNRKNIGEIIDLDGIPQVMWPDHCIQETFGADFHPSLNKKKVTHIVQKGKNPNVDSYSAFQDNNKLIKTDLADFLNQNKIDTLEIVGLALDYCVKATCLDAVDEGFSTYLHFRGTRAVNISPNDAKNTIYELIQNGINIIS